MLFFLLIGDVDREQFFFFVTKEIDANGRVLLFKFRYVFHFHWKLNSTYVQFLFVTFVVSNAMWVIFPVDWVKGCQNTPEKALFILVLYIEYRLFVL